MGYAMKKINLILGNHNHQPVGNFGFVFDKAYENAYEPFLQALVKKDSLKFNFHYSGPLLDYLEEAHPNHLDTLASLVKEGRVEMISGGYYEPIFASIAERDRLKQISLMNNYIQKRFGMKPNGAWIAERVWEPAFAKTLSLGELKYIIVDDTHLQGSAVNLSDYGYYTTDDEEHRVSVFPISKMLRYLIPFKSVESVIELLDKLATEDGNRVLVLHDDGEKYGDWPQTYEHVYTNGWLSQFLDALEHESWINLTTYSEYMEKHPPLSRVYMPTASYDEMGEWVLPASAQRSLHSLKKEFEDNGREEEKKFLSGSFWRNFFVKYPESNNMQKRMLYASKAVEQMKTNKEEAEKHLLMGQCNCPYWHGTFGGIYLNHLRYANYSNIIKAHLLAESERGKRYLYAEEKDIDLDGKNECIISNNKQTLFFHREGGRLYEWDCKFSPINLIDTLGRQEEAYHEAVYKKKEIKLEEDSGEMKSIHEREKQFDEDTAKYLVFDNAPKSMFVDRLLENTPSAEDFMLLRYNDISSFTKSLYNMEVTSNERSASVILSTSSKVKDTEVSIKKRIDTGYGGGMSVSYDITNMKGITFTAVLAIEMNLTLLAPDADDRYYFVLEGGKRTRIKDSKMNSIGELSSNSLGLCDEGYKKIAVLFESPSKVTFLRMPNITVSDAVDHLEKAYQNSTVVILKQIELDGMESESLDFTITLDSLE